MAIFNGVKVGAHFNGVKVGGYLNGQKVFGDSEINYIKDGLTIWLDALNNTGSGHNNSATAWTDLISNTQIPIERAAWTDNALNGISGLSNSVQFAAPVLPALDDFTIEMISNVTSQAGNSSRYFGQGSTNRLMIQRAIAGHIQFSINNAVSNSMTASIVNLDIGYNIALSRESGIFKIYLNGQLAGTNSANLSFQIDQTPLFLFREYVGTTMRMYGRFNGFRAYSRALTDRELQNNFAVDSAKYLI